MINNSGLVIIGAGGHAKVVLSVALHFDKTILGYLDDDKTLLHQRMNGYLVIGGTPFLSSHTGSAVLGLGDNAKRKKISESYSFFTAWESLIHPTAYVHPSAKIGKGTVIFAGAIIQPDVEIGEHCIINTGATVDHDCTIGNFVHLAPGVHLAGGVTIEEGSFLGIGSVVIPGIHIGDWVQVAAGGVVVHAIPARKTVMGVPAKEKA